jgi:hypothetical protein
MTIHPKFHRAGSSIPLLACVLAAAWAFAVGARADMDAGAAALLQKITGAYKNAPSFSSDGHYEVDMQTANPVKLMGTFKMLYARPDEIRVDWTDTKMGGEVITSSVFTRNKTLYFLFGAVNKVSPESSMDMALSTAAGVSHGISYGIPNLLLGKPGYYTFTSLQPLSHAAREGKDCLVLKGATKFQGDVTLTVDPATDVIYQIEQRQVIKSADMQRHMAEMRAKLAKTNPTLAAQMAMIPVQPDFTSVQTTTFHAPIFGKLLLAADFDYPVPGSVTKVANAVK